MTTFRWVMIIRCAVIILLVLSATILFDYASSTTSLPLIVQITPLTTSFINQTLSPSSTTLPPPSSAPAKPIQAPVPSVIYAKDIYEAGHQTPHPEICPSLGAHLKLLILITSAPDHADARNAIRLTWGHYSKRTDLALAFFLGSPADYLEERLKEEDSLYGDLIMGNNVDSYSNLTLKTLSMLEWTLTYCPRVPYVLKTDDDMFINIPNLLNLLKSPRVANASKSIWGCRFSKKIPINRNKIHKYHMPPSQHPGKVFPNFVSGPAYLISSDCILPLFKTALQERYMWLEDIFITGIVARISGIKRRHDPRFHSRFDRNSCAIRWSISLHSIRYKEQFKIWRKLNDNKFICQTPKRKRPDAISSPHYY